ncbi:SSL2 DNA or RNA helicases of superfamily II [uncultured Caudovirales phage]|uniref:SSL2 DNA or RNA helicases of superfamily II n=1 Tax=uncultured Caudovirales phage TaxID=2100421 RepID=A0A6J5S9X4_9CAUD|nr:SSL2 DNA or RNA helicases of superfamily II [uncultured Caudovirales phage]CAB4176266.1 SSL2 DNA or RNA helicases of superfamily II [uncultured Caudovirales phage]CAB4181669.1 SSL2 DNA or RNA helicases of superfamily II [uncultured Caudovirales phage]CAB4189856.1 SSL2 DNA or RNA helicases of superfamily II [uncultured Caudovirales phage]CAB4210405.1 SSL2 DNA or RNA helicases of superfamily II [uncultured Caudovirales phage]
MADKIIISNKDEVFVRVSCSEGAAQEIREYFTFQVPGYQFTPQYKAKLWDGKIRLFDSRTRQIYRGLVPNIIKFCEERDYDWEYDNELYDEELSLAEAEQFIKSLNIPLEPRDYQIDAFVHAIRSRRALLLSPTASGKSLIIYLIVRYLNARKTLIIVPTISLVSQLASDFADYGFDSDVHIHRIFGGQDKFTDRPITISTWQSLYTLPKEYFTEFDVIIGDEAHLFKAKSLAEIMTALVNAKYRIGTTGTLDGTKTHKLVLEGLFGPVRKVITTKELMDNKVVADFHIKCLLLKHPDSICQAAKNFSYQQEIEYLVLNERRNQFITNLALSLEGNTLILYQYVDKHGKILHEMINKKADGRKIFFVSGEVDGDAREDIRRIVETQTDAIIVASFGTFSTGINIRNLHNIIFASPSKSRVRNLQSIGRGLRKSETKDSAVLFDIADDLRHKKHDNFTLKHFAERIKIYSEEKFKFKIYKIELKG